MNARSILIIGLLLMMLGIISGAFGAHALKAMVSERHLEIWKTAAHYQTLHALGLIGLGIYAQLNALNVWIKLCGVCLIAGVIVFSGSLYGIVLLGLPRLGMLTPVGGVLFILGWLSWIVGVIYKKA